MHNPLKHWHTHNRFELLVDSRQFLPAILTAIRNARESVYLEQYLVESGTILNDFITALREAAETGVRILLLFDDYGARDLSTHDLARLRGAGITVNFYNPFKWSTLYSSLRRNHRKLLLIDNKIAFVGGACISDEYLYEPGSMQSWHDTVVRIEGEVVPDWIQSFAQTWYASTGEMLATDIPAAVVDEKQPGRIALANGLGKNQIIQHAIAHVKKSNRIIWIATPYFVITRKLRRALKKAAYRGIDVRLLLPGEITDHLWLTQAARRYYARLLKNGVQIYEYQPRFIHAKLIICDDWVSIGSSNLDRWNHFWNLDANQEILDGKFADQVRELFERDFAQSSRIDPAIWRQRPWLQRMRESWSSLKVRIIQWLTFLATRRRKKNGLD